MKRTKIFLYHLLIFVVGSIGIVVYVFNRLATSSSGAGIGGVVVMPAVMVVYIVVFGVLCLISLFVWFLVSYFRNRVKRYVRLKRSGQFSKTVV